MPDGFLKICHNTGFSDFIELLRWVIYYGKPCIITILVLNTPQWTSVCGFKHFPAPPNFDHVTIPERTKLTVMERVPQFPPGLKPPKMQKRLRYMRGKEMVHNFLLHQQYGIMALGGGRLKYQHFEVMRLGIGRKMDTQRMFAIWRVDAPWQPVTKRGQGQRLGGGKGAIDHYVTPIKAGRIIVELGGKCEFDEVKDFLQKIAEKLPFKAMAVSHELLQEMRRKEIEDEKNNLNFYTMKYVIQNNMGGCQNWLSPFDFKWFCKHV
ncbi:39S ribosomal protein L16, mitochondrial [Photinus pyralis]|uniref:39S ribosomal protein L16, mitochondrial n=1 Tax=Photinus pyralis TaxID=7054 RepID=UPI00126726A7|nr:39S ribosomal protein L16, mitochondrial [Photinus pyralis]